MPSDQNDVVVRFENLADRFDGVNNTSNWNLDLQKFAKNLYEQANNGAQPELIKIEELDLQGVHPIHRG